MCSNGTYYCKLGPDDDHKGRVHGKDIGCDWQCEAPKVGYLPVAPVSTR